MSNKTYDILKWIAFIGMPAFITFYGAVAIAWGFPYTEQILTTLGAVETLLGSCLTYSTSQYNKATAAGDVNLEAKVDE